METKPQIKATNPICGLAAMHEVSMPGGKKCLMSNVVGASCFMILFSDDERRTGTLAVVPKDVAEQIKAASNPADEDSKPTTDEPETDASTTTEN